MILSAFFYDIGMSLFRTIELIRYGVPYFGEFSDELPIQNWFKVRNKPYTGKV